MSKVKDVKVLTPADVQKKIIAHSPVVRPKEEQLGPLNKYRDELFDRYNEKKKLFFETCKKYNRLNQETLICGKKMLLEDYRERLECHDLINSDDEECETITSASGKLVRRRTERHIHEVTQPTNQPCCLEPWVMRHLLLNKFIWAARKTILTNRLLKVLEKLRTVDAETIKALEKRQRKFLNVSYGEIFEKFM